MKILVVSVSFPAPARSGGERRLSSLLAGLASRHELGIVALRRNVPDPELEKRIAYVDLVDPASRPPALPYPLSALRVWWNTMFAPVPQFASGSNTDAFRAAVDRALVEFRPDLVHVEPVDVAHVIPRLKKSGVPVSFGAIEIVTAKSERWMEIVQKRAHRFAGSRELARTRRLEGAAFRAADAIVCVSSEDRDAIRSRIGRDAVVAENGVDSVFFAPQPTTRDPFTVVMIGPLSYAANLDAVTWFSAEVLPLLPGVGLDVVGTFTAIEAGLPGVRLLGAVDDVRPHLARAGALVAPLRIGGGTRLKILEALAMETPVVTTTIGAEGLAARDGEHLLIADDPASFAAAVQRVLNDPELATALGRAGREIVARKYGWNRSVEALEAVFARTVAPASRTHS